MDTGIVIAIITSVGAFIVGVIGFITSIITARQNNKLDKQLELFRDTLISKHTNQEFHDEYLKESLSSLKDAIQVIQLLKDEIYFILNSVETSLDSDLAINHIKKAREDLFVIYEKVLPCISKKEAKVFHEVKNKAIIVENKLIHSLNNKKYASEIDLETSNMLIEIRNIISERQQFLRDCRMDRILDRIEKV